MSVMLTARPHEALCCRHSHLALFPLALHNTSVSRCPGQGRHAPNSAGGCGRGIRLNKLPFIIRDSAHKSWCIASQHRNSPSPCCAPSTSLHLWGVLPKYTSHTHTTRGCCCCRSALGVPRPPGAPALSCCFPPGDRSPSLQSTQVPWSRDSACNEAQRLSRGIFGFLPPRGAHLNQPLPQQADGTRGWARPAAGQPTPCISLP